MHFAGSHDSVGDSEGASAEPVVGAEATLVQPMLVEKSKQVLVRKALPGAPRPAAGSRATRWPAQSTMIRTHARPGRALQRVASACADAICHFLPVIVSFDQCESSNRSGCRVLSVQVPSRRAGAAGSDTAAKVCANPKPLPIPERPLLGCMVISRHSLTCVSPLVRIVQLARPAFGWFFTILKLLSMLLVVALCTTSALFSCGKRAIGASPYGGWVGGGSWSVHDSSAAELLTMKVRSDWPSIGHR